MQAHRTIIHMVRENKREATAFCYNLFIGASRGPPMPPGGGRKPGGPAAGGPPMHGLGGIRAQLNAQFGGSSIPAKPTG